VLTRLQIAAMSFQQNFMECNSPALLLVIFLPRPAGQNSLFSITFEPFENLRKISVSFPLIPSEIWIVGSHRPQMYRVDPDRSRRGPTQSDQSGPRSLIFPSVVFRSVVFPFLIFATVPLPHLPPLPLRP
jgi:hypothetical protein